MLGNKERRVIKSPKAAHCELHGWVLGDSYECVTCTSLLNMITKRDKCSLEEAKVKLKAMAAITNS